MLCPLLTSLSILDTFSHRTWTQLQNPSQARSLATTNYPKVADEIKVMSLLNQLLHCADGETEANHPSSHMSDAKPEREPRAPDLYFQPWRQKTQLLRKAELGRLGSKHWSKRSQGQSWLCTPHSHSNHHSKILEGRKEKGFWSVLIDLNKAFIYINFPVLIITLWGDTTMIPTLQMRQ